MKAIELLQYLKDGMDTGYPPKHIINNAIEEIESLEESNKELLEGLISTQKRLEEWLEKEQDLREKSGIYFWL